MHPSVIVCPTCAPIAYQLPHLCYTSVIVCLTCAPIGYQLPNLCTHRLSFAPPVHRSVSNCLTCAPIAYQLPHLCTDQLSIASPLLHIGINMPHLCDKVLRFTEAHGLERPQRRVRQLLHCINVSIKQNERCVRVTSCNGLRRV